MPCQAVSVHLTRRRLDYQKPPVPNFMPLKGFFLAQALALFFLVALTSAPVMAQDVQMVPDRQDKESATKAQSQKDQDQDQVPAATFKANVDIVQLFFNVKDKKGGLVPNLPKENFEILEDGK